MRVISKKAARHVRHIRVSAAARSSSLYAFSAPYLITETVIPRAASMATAKNTRVDTSGEGLPRNPLNDPSDPMNFSRLADDFSTLTLDNDMQDQSTTSTPDHPSLHIKEIKVADTVLCLRSDWTYKSIQDAFGVDESGIDEDTAHTATLQEKQICLRNIRHVACFHGFDLKEMSPDVFPEEESSTMIPANLH